MEKIKLHIVLCVVLVALAACSKKNNPPPTPPPPPPPPPVVNDPVAATLVAPANNQPCLAGTSVSSTLSTVTFSWNKSNYTDTYEVHIISLLTNDTVVQSTSGLALTVNLLKSTPYKWYVVSKENNVTVTAESDPWKFYNSGPGVTTYAPYPADLLSPTWGQQLPYLITVQPETLQWQGTPGSAAILNYDVCFGTTPSPPVYWANYTAGTTLVVGVQPSTVYYWQIITRDVNNNTTASQVYNFYVEK